MSSSSLDLSLPDAPRSPRRAGVLRVLTCLASLVCVALLTLLLLRQEDGVDSGPGDSIPTRSPDHLRALAQDLEKHTLFAEAARHWGEYLATAELSDRDRVTTLYRRGVCLQKSGAAQQAAAVFTEIAILNPKPSREQRRDAQQRLLECLSSLGKEDVRKYVLEKSTVDNEPGTSPVLANIGNEPVTMEDVRRELTDRMFGQLSHFGSGDPAAMAKEVESMVSRQLSSKESLTQAVQQVLASRVLYREALSRGYGSGEEFERALSGFRRGYLGQRLLDAERQDLLQTITEIDVKNHYEANRASYVEPESVGFSHLSRPTEEAATQAAEAIASGAEAAAGLLSELVPAPDAARAGEPLPGLGRSSEAVAQLLVLEEGAVTREPVKIGDSWHVLRVDSKNPSRQLTFQEAGESARADLAREKQAEAMSRLQARLGQKFDVQIFADELDKAVNAGATESATGNADASEGKGDATP